MLVVVDVVLDVVVDVVFDVVVLDVVLDVGGVGWGVGCGGGCGVGYGGVGCGRCLGQAATPWGSSSSAPLQRGKDPYNQPLVLF